MTPADRSLQNLGIDPPAALTPPDPASPAGVILAAARELFADKGFAGTSTRSIASAAGVNLAMIHYYYGTKAQLYRRVVEHELIDLHRIIRETLTDDATPDEIILEMPFLSLRLHQDHPLLTRLILREMADGGPQLPQILAELGDYGPVGLGRRLRELTIRAQDDGFASDLPPAQILAVLWAVGNGLQAFAPLLNAIFGVDPADPATRGELEHTIKTIFRRALAPGKEQ